MQNDYAYLEVNERERDATFQRIIKKSYVKNKQTIANMDWIRWKIWFHATEETITAWLLSINTVYFDKL